MKLINVTTQQYINKTGVIELKTTKAPLIAIV